MLRGARASRALVSASRRNNLPLTALGQEKSATRESFWRRQRARRARSPEKRLQAVADLELSSSNRRLVNSKRESGSNQHLGPAHRRPRRDRLTLLSWRADQTKYALNARGGGRFARPIFRGPGATDGPRRRPGARFRYRRCRLA